MGGSHLMFDLDVLAICKDKDKYERYSPFIKRHSLSEESWRVFEDMGSWFATNNDISWPSFTTWFKLVKHPSFDSAKLKLYDLLFDKLMSHEVDEDLEKELTESLIGRDYATKIADKALSISEGSEVDKMEDLLALTAEYENEVQSSAKIDDYIVTSDIYELVELNSTKGGISWRTSQLNDAIGNIRKAHFVIFVSRPGSGKTTFLASESSHFLPQLDEEQCILWFNNEEAGHSVKHRCVQAGIGWNSEQIELDPLGALERFEKQCGKLDRIQIIDSASMTTHVMEQKIKSMNPGVIIFDQLWKVHGFHKESANEVQRQTMLFNWGREMSKEYAPVITVHQAGGDAEGQRWINMSQLYGSSTGIQGEADAIITMGRTNEPGEEKLRFFSIPKTKMRGKIPKYKNGKFIAEFDDDIGRFITDGDFEIT